MKQDNYYDRFRRTGLVSISMELMLITLGMNIKKYLRGVAVKNYWNATSDTKPQVFKKPSAKRIIKRISKKKTLQPNEKARKKL